MHKLSKPPNFARIRLFLTVKSVLCKTHINYGTNRPEKWKTLHDFMPQHSTRLDTEPTKLPYISDVHIDGQQKKVYYEVYGCPMNTNDSQVIRSVMQSSNYIETRTFREADVIFLVTCSIRDRSEEKIWERLIKLRKLSRSKRNLQIGVLGCMAERLKSSILEKEKIVDLVAGPDSYRDLPRLLHTAAQGMDAVNVMLSLDETYADIQPVRMDASSPTALISIMRGCDNMCSYCIVPFTRGRERSRPVHSILNEVKLLSEQGVKDITLLGQNVNSYRDKSLSKSISVPQQTAPGFKTVYKPKVGGLTFAHLLEKVAQVDPEMRIRFTSPHPKDFPDDVLHVISAHPNVCHKLHVPAQSGNDGVLESMNRGYTRKTYLQLIERIRQILPDVCFTSDFISGFCGETEDAHKDTLSLIEQVQYDFVYCYPYSMREKTKAHRRLDDDIPESVKNRRAQEVHDVFRQEALKLHKRLIGTRQLVLVEKESKRSAEDYEGRTEGGTKVIFPKMPIPNINSLHVPDTADYVEVEITDCSSQVLKGLPLRKTTIAQFYTNMHL